MTGKSRVRSTMERWRRGQLESIKLMSKSQAALLRQYVADRIHQRDSLVEAALALVVSSSGGDNEVGDGCDKAAAQELLDWQKRLNDESRDFDPTDAVVTERLGDEVKHLRKEYRAQSRKLEDMQYIQDSRDYDEEELRNKLRRSEAQNAKLLGFLRDVREEVSAKQQGVPEEDYRRLRQKYERAKAKIKSLNAAVAVVEGATSRPIEEEGEGEGEGEDDKEAFGMRGIAQADPAFLRPSPPRLESLEGEEEESAEESEEGAKEIDVADANVGVGNADDGAEESSPKQEVTRQIASTVDSAVGSTTTAAVGGAGETSRSEEREEEEMGEAEGAGEATENSVETENTGRLRLELAEANRRVAKAKKGRKASEKEKEALVLAMAKELSELEDSKDRQIQASDREVKRLRALLAGNQQAVRELARRASSEKAAVGALSAEVKKRLRAIPDVGAAALRSVQSQLSGVEGMMTEVRKQYAREYRERRRLFNVVQELRGNIRVFCRCRPVTPQEINEAVCVSFAGEGGIELVNQKSKRKSWSFDQVFGLEATQEAVYGEVSPLVISVMDGYNACIFAYGQTGTGKTYTMMGPTSNRGVNARALQDLFTRSTSRRGEVDDTITLSILEIYNEQIRDLLSETSVGEQRKLEVRQGERGNNVPGLTTIAVSSLEEVLRMLGTADRNRASACTNLNDHSSRSHLIMSVNVDGVNRHTGATTAGRLHLIDLAGSERISKSGAAGQALREAQNINRSLSALGDVISARASRQGHVPYRNSTLTYLLQDSLSADSKTLMLVCVSPVIINAEESSCSLNFAARVRTVELGKAHKHVENRSGTPKGGSSSVFFGSGSNSGGSSGGGGGGSSPLNSSSPATKRPVGGGNFSWSPAAAAAAAARAGNKRSG